MKKSNLVRFFGTIMVMVLIFPIKSLPLTNREVMKKNLFFDQTDSENHSETSRPEYWALMYDQYGSARSGTENILTSLHIFNEIKGRWLKTKWFSENNVLTKSSGILLRLATWRFIDFPVDYLAYVFYHEYYGHGFFPRRDGFDPIRYEYNFPSPYGKGGGGVTLNGYQPPGGVWSVDDRLAYSIGGITAGDYMRRRMHLNWVGRGAVHYREALFFNLLFEDTFDYIMETEPVYEGDATGHDTSNYLWMLNRKNGYSAEQGYQFSIKGLKSRNYLRLLNPFFLQSLYTQFKTYFWDGEKQHKLWMIPIGSWRYLPSFHVALSPFGPEYDLENYFVHNNKTYQVTLKWGDRTLYDFWGGLSVFVSPLFTARGFNLEAGVDLWTQPEFERGGSTLKNIGGGLGMAVNLRGYIDIVREKMPLSLVVEAGYKSAGFLEGYPHDSGLFIIAGLALKK